MSFLSLMVLFHSFISGYIDNRRVLYEYEERMIKEKKKKKKAILQSLQHLPADAIAWCFLVIAFRSFLLF